MTDATVIAAAPPPSEKPRPLRAANMIAVASGKGGVGKTFCSITLTHALATLGQSALLFDGDLGLANVDVQLGLMPTRDLGAVILGRLTLNQAKVPFPPGNFDIIAGRSGAGSLSALPPTRLSILGSDLAAFAGQYDYVVMDLGAGVDRMVRQLASHAGIRLVIVTSEPTSLTDAYAFIKVSVADDPNVDLRIVVNQARTAGEAERTYSTLVRACENFLKYSPPLAGIVRRDRRVVECIRAQTPLIARFPTSEAAVDIRAIAQRLVQNH